MNEKNKKGMLKSIKEYAKYLKLPCINADVENNIKDATINDICYEEFLLKLLEKEYDKRIENGKKNRIRLAQFPYKKYLEDLITNELPKDAQKKLKMLSTLDF